MSSAYKAIVKRAGKWWIGWLEEIPGVNGQGRTRAACLSSLRSALKEALEMNRAEAILAADGAYEEVSISL